MEPQTLDEWNAALQALNSDLKRVHTSIVDKNTQIRNGTPKATLTRERTENRKNLQQIERLSFLNISDHFLTCSFIFYRTLPAIGHSKGPPHPDRENWT
jgi:hypothetical protein